MCGPAEVVRTVSRPGSDPPGVRRTWQNIWLQLTRLPSSNLGRRVLGGSESGTHAVQEPPDLTPEGQFFMWCEKDHLLSSWISRGSDQWFGLEQVRQD